MLATGEAGTIVDQSFDLSGMVRIVTGSPVHNYNTPALVTLRAVELAETVRMSRAHFHTPTL